MNKEPGAPDDRPLYTLRIASQLADILAHSIRQYVDNGLILPYKLDSNRHLYSQNDIRRLRNIHILIHEKGLNFSGIKTLMAMIPCWAIHQCSKEDKFGCSAYSEGFSPCWEASDKGRTCRNENCRECKVYKQLSQDIDFKSVLGNLV